MPNPNADNCIAYLSKKYGYPQGEHLSSGCYVRSESILPAMEYLKNEGFVYLSDITSIDLPEEDEFEVIYHLRPLGGPQLLAIRTRVNRRRPFTPSVTGLWQAANWLEREVYDLMGIIFDGHPEMKRILMPDDYIGHPLRKDFVDPRPAGKWGRRDVK